MKRREMKVPLIIAIILLIGAGFYRVNSPDKGADNEKAYFVKRVIDGDTILLGNGERVRYIGINTPETKHPHKGVEYFGREASQYNKKLVDKKMVRLEFDVEKRDRYQRLLAYVYVDDIFVNARLVQDGYAQVYTVPPNVRHHELFLKLQRVAREEGRGLWAED